jgi:hypothetical protein
MKDYNAASPTAILTNEQIVALVSALPDCKSPHRRALLPRILEEWSQIDLLEHLSRAAPKQIRAERRQLERLARQADELAQAFSALDLDCRFAVAGRLLQPNADTARIGPSFRSTQRMDRILENCPARLRRLAAGATQVANDWVPTPMREGMLKRYLVLQDLAAIFEWATGSRAGRRVRTEDHDYAGEEYGPFWNFARMAWPMIFGSDQGLSNAIRRWAKLLTQNHAVSPFLPNINLRHPEWRIREP